MSEKPEALRLADNLYAEYRGFSCIEIDAAAELRRLHAENERLREALAWSLKNGVVYHRTYDAYEGFSDAGCSCCSSSIEPPPHLQEMILKIARREDT